FEEGPERNKALGVWGALGGSGAAVGVLAGGILTDYLSWRWIFFVNVPVGALVLLLTPRIVPESRRDTTGRQYDALGAVLVSAGLALLVYAISEAPKEGWGSARTILLLIVSGARVDRRAAGRRRAPAGAAVRSIQPVHAARGSRRRRGRVAGVREPLQGAGHGRPPGAGRAHARLRLRVVGACIVRRRRDHRRGD